MTGGGLDEYWVTLSHFRDLFAAKWDCMAWRVLASRAVFRKTDLPSSATLPTVFFERVHKGSYKPYENPLPSNCCTFVEHGRQCATFEPGPGRRWALSGAFKRRWRRRYLRGFFFRSGFRSVFFRLWRFFLWPGLGAARPRLW